MTNFRATVLILPFIATLCLSRIIIETRRFSSDLDMKAAINVLKSCYMVNTTRMNNAIGIVGNLSDSLVLALTSADEESNYHSVILLYNTRRRWFGDLGEKAIRKSPNKLLIFVITTSALTNQFDKILVDIKNSQWWNHMAHFIILSTDDQEPIMLQQQDVGCSARAFKILSTAWTMNLLNANFFCTITNETTVTILIYSFNPYTSNAPNPWHFVKTYRDIGGRSDREQQQQHPWSLFVRQYVDDTADDSSRICNNMDFDKTANLDGYSIRSTILEWSFEIFIDKNKSKTEALNGANSEFVKSIFNAINATPVFIVHERGSVRGYLDREGKAHGILSDMVNGTSDIGLNDRYLVSIDNLPTIPLRWQSTMAIMTRYTGEKSQLSKIVSVIDRSSRIGVCLVGLVTLVILKYSMGQDIATAILNIVRIICNASLTNLPNNLASRIYLVGLLIFIITIQGIYQGQMSSLLSKRVPRPNIERKLDLAVQSDYTIYGHDGYATYFDEPEFNGRFIGIKDYYCTKEVLSNPKAACVFDRLALMPEAIRNELHLSRESINVFEMAWIIREDWPLEQRIDITVGRLFEAHLTRYSADISTEKLLRAIEAKENQGTDVNFKVLTLDDLRFAFVILGIGLTFSTMSFVVERFIIARVLTNM